MAPFTGDGNQKKDFSALSLWDSPKKSYFGFVSMGLLQKKFFLPPSQWDCFKIKFFGFGPLVQNKKYLAFLCCNTIYFNLLNCLLFRLINLLLEPENTKTIRCNLRMCSDISTFIFLLDYSLLVLSYKITIWPKSFFAPLLFIIFAFNSI